MKHPVFCRAMKKWLSPPQNFNQQNVKSCFAQVYISCLRCVGDWRWWKFLTMVRYGNKDKWLSLVKNSPKTIYNHHCYLSWKTFFFEFSNYKFKKKIKKFKLRLMQRDAGCKLYAIGLFICGKIYRKNMSFKILNQNLKKNKELKIWGMHMLIIYLWTNTAENTVISPNFLANCPKLCGNCTFPQNFHTRRLGEIKVFFAVKV